MRLRFEQDEQRSRPAVDAEILRTCGGMQDDRARKADWRRLSEVVRLGEAQPVSGGGVVLDIDWLGLSLLIIHVTLALIAAIYVSANRKPSSAIAWLMAVIFIPVIGILFFLLVGAGRLPKHRRDKQRYVSEYIMQRTEGGLEHMWSNRDEWPDWLPSIAVLNRNLGALPMIGGNAVTLIADYRGSIQAMADDIDRAKTYVHVEFFILVHDETTAPFFEALRRARARGVTVRVLSDHMAQFSYPNRKETVQLLEDMGAEYRPMLPIQPFRGHWRRPDLRNHRKIVVVDGEVAHVGSQNMIVDHYHQKKNIARGLHWQELVGRFEGPIVRELDAVFITDWYSETEDALDPPYHPIVLDEQPGNWDAQVIPSGPSFENDNNLKLFAAVIQNARHRVSVTSPYFVPDESIQMAMVTAGSRGLDVELFVSEISDQFMVFHAQRSYYEQLLRAGVKIYLYAAPTVLHAKHLSIDDDIGIIGSSNLDIRSLSLHMELMVLVQSRDFVDAMRKVEDDYRANSRLLTLEEWIQRPFRDRAFDNMMRMTSALM
jgi:cardiolipin synthase A/B